MKFDIKPKDRAFLRLAEKVASETGSGKELAELEVIMKEHPELKEEFDELRKDLRDEKSAEFWSVAVRVMVGTAKPEEKKRVESLKASDPRKWWKYQDALEFLRGMASRRDVLKANKVEPMPPHVRKVLLKQLSLEKSGGKPK